MDEQLGLEEMRTFAGHLLAELFEARDHLKHGKLTQQQYLERVRQIRRRTRSGENGLLRSMESIQLQFENVMNQASTLRRGTPAVS